jgi:channel protein (hemolysin III family)
MGSNPADKRHPVNLYTIGEEIANSITHGIGAGFSIVGLTVLIIFAAFKNSSLHIVSFSIYGATLVLLYLASTLYHSIQHPPAKRILQRIDHAAIYLLIAGTYTPFLLVSLRNAWGWTLLVVIWGLAILGIAYKLLFLEYYEKISALGYVLMGWLCLIAGRQLLTNGDPHLDRSGRCDIHSRCHLPFTAPNPLPAHDLACFCTGWQPVSLLCSLQTPEHCMMSSSTDQACSNVQTTTYPNT